MFMCNKLWHISLGEDVLCCLDYLQDAESLFLWDSDLRVRKFRTPDSNSRSKITLCLRLYDLLCDIMMYLRMT